MKLLYLALIGPILWLATVPVYLSAIPVAVAALLAFLEYCHSTANSVIKAQNAANHAPSEDLAEDESPPQATSVAEDAVRSKLIAAGIIKPTSVDLSEAHAANAPVPTVSLNEPLSLSAIEGHLPQDEAMLAGLTPQQSASETFLAVVPSESAEVPAPLAEPLGQTASELSTLELSLNDEWASNPQGY